MHLKGPWYDQDCLLNVAAVRKSAQRQGGNEAIHMSESRIEPWIERTERNQIKNIADRRPTS